MSFTRFVLFDIDGTILRGGPLWKECFLRSLKEHYPHLEFPAVPFGGKTDLQIVRELMAQAGIDQTTINAAMQKIAERYVEYAINEAKSRKHEVELLPGVRELLEDLSSRKEVFLGLLTGNVRKGAHAKLECVGLNNYFKFGVFGDDHWDRYKLPELAVNRVRKEHGLEFNRKQIVIIGDTVHDVNCGKSIGARSIAVGTGRGIPVEELLAQNPDFFFRDLSSTFEVIQAILDEVDE